MKRKQVLWAVPLFLVFMVILAVFVLDKEERAANGTSVSNDSTLEGQVAVKDRAGPDKYRIDYQIKEDSSSRKIIWTSIPAAGPDLMICLESTAGITIICDDLEPKQASGTLYVLDDMADLKGCEVHFLPR